MLLYLPVFGYIVWMKLWRNRTIWRQQWPWLLGAGLLFIGLVAFFYVPYLLSPQVGLVYQYFASERIGESFLYNRVDNLFDQDKLYSHNRGISLGASNLDIQAIWHLSFIN